MEDRLFFGVIAFLISIFFTSEKFKLNNKKYFQQKDFFFK